jgi:hypothetical protein
LILRKILHETLVKKLLAALRKSSISLKIAPEAAWDPKNSSENPHLTSTFFADFLGIVWEIDTGENKRSNNRGGNYEKGIQHCQN